MVRVFYPELLESNPVQKAEAEALGKRTYELSEFLVNVAGVADVGAVFPHSVTYHASCHGLRELHIREEPLRLLQAVKGINLMEMPRHDECCGFGGTFATKMEPISIAMGVSKAESVAASGAEYVTALDGSCLMHLQGVMSKRGFKSRTIHLASILASQAN
jgi:L-lactate dehydrogenase complex protein LldE